MMLTSSKHLRTSPVQDDTCTWPRWPQSFFSLWADTQKTDRIRWPKDLGTLSCARVIPCGYAAGSMRPRRTPIPPPAAMVGVATLGPVAGQWITMNHGCLLFQGNPTKSVEGCGGFSVLEGHYDMRLHGALCGPHRGREHRVDRKKSAASQVQDGDTIAVVGAGGNVSHQDGGGRLLGWLKTSRLPQSYIPIYI